MILDSVPFLPYQENSILIWRWELVQRIISICSQALLWRCNQTLFFLSPLQDSLPPSCKNVEVDKAPNACPAIPKFRGNFLNSDTKFDAIPWDHILHLVYLLLTWCPGEWNSWVKVIFCLDLQVKLRIHCTFSISMIVFSFLILSTINEFVDFWWSS